MKTRKRPKPGNEKVHHRKWNTLAGVLICLLGSSAAPRSAQAFNVQEDNANPIVTPDTGPASLYPSSITFSNVPGKIIRMSLRLRQMTHTFPDDYDILLVGPQGQKAMLMSDCGGSVAVVNYTVFITETALAMPDSSALDDPYGYLPTNYSGGSDPHDIFPPNAANIYSTSLAVFNNTDPNGTWNLYVVDDATGDTGVIQGGWTLYLETTASTTSDPIAIPLSGPANPYPEPVLLGVHGRVKKVRVKLENISHTFPNDIDVLLVGPGGETAVIMSDVGGGQDISGVTLTLDDAAANSLPLLGPIVSGTFKPTNDGSGDTFPSPAPVPTGLSALSVFNGTQLGGAWHLYVVDDNNSDAGSIGSWSLEVDPEPTVLANISTRLPVGTGDNVLIGGFIVTGTQPKRVLLRAIGPSLPVAGALQNPILELRNGQGGLLWHNDNWQSGTQGFPSQAAEITATGAAPSNTSESAIVITLPANNAAYTAIVSGASNSTGIGLVEAYDLDRTVDSKLANISTRGLVQTGDDVLIAGTIVLGGVSQRAIIRAIGPSLALPDKLADPILEVRNEDGFLLVSNDNWQDGQEADVITSTIPPSNALESAVVLDLQTTGATPYTAIVRGANGTTGVAVVEVYALN